MSRFDPAAPGLVLPFEVVNSASYLPGAVAPGEFVTLFGSGIGPAQSLKYQLDASGRVSTALGGIRVLFDQTTAPLLYVDPNQINAVVPYDTASKQQVRVVIEKNGVSGPAQNIELANVSPTFTVVAPGVFTMTASGRQTLGAGTPRELRNRRSRLIFVILWSSGAFANELSGIHERLPAFRRAQPELSQARQMSADVLRCPEFRQTSAGKKGTRLAAPASPIQLCNR